MVLFLLLGWFYAVFLACLVPCLWHVLWPQLGGYCGQWTRAVSGKKLACIGAAKELSGTPVCGSHAIAWLGSNLHPRVRYYVGFHAIA